MKDKKLFEKGEFTFHTPILGTSDLPSKKVKDRIEWSNTPKMLNTFFFRKEIIKLIRAKKNINVKLEPNTNTWIVLKNEFNDLNRDIYLVSVKLPTSGYSEAALLSVVGRVSQLTGDNKINELLYDYPLHVQMLYWNTVFNIMRNYFLLRSKNKLPKPFSRYVPIVMGHHGRSLSNYPPHKKNPGIRTVILHHDHLVFLDFKTFKKLSWKDSKFNLDKEFKLYFQENTPNILRFIDLLNSHSKLKESGIKLSPRKTKPAGYAVNINYEPVNIVNIVKFLLGHFQAYRDISAKHKLFDRSKIIQPAFTFYFYPKSSKIGHLLFSPNIISKKDMVPGGPEKAGLLIRRRPDVKPTISTKSKKNFANKLVEL
jgi:hypothetical protein